MNTYDPRNWVGRRQRDNDPNREHLLRFALLISASLCFASFLPREAVAAAFIHLLWIAALATAAVAALLEESPRAPHLTYWDEAAAALFVAVGTDVLLRL